MAGTPPSLDFDFLRSQIIGVDTAFQTPFGERRMVYCDYTASGRCLGFVERYLQRIQQRYANTHTEDDVTGRSMTRLLHEAESAIKAGVNAGPDGRIIACGTGATGAIEKLQQILGIHLPPATRFVLDGLHERVLTAGQRGDLAQFVAAHRPVVFVGPYEHHSNEVTWRHGLASVVEVRLAEDGGIDLAHLDALLRDPAHHGRLRIGAFSAASNVTGMRSPVHAIARMLHRHGALACFDYAACAPYVDIDMNPAPGAEGGDPSLDAVYFSPHKFLGGPGASGVLVFNQRIYHRDLAPSVGGGGTVDYVSVAGEDFIADIEERERAGTPGVLQTMKAALAMQVKEAVGVARIEAREAQLTRRAMARWSQNPGIGILGNPDPARRVGIISFTVSAPDGRHLHPKFVTALMNDLFGIQSRGGCSCAGPYGHRLLDIDAERSERYRLGVARGCAGIKPGWCRVGLHYAMDDAEADYVIEAVDLVGRMGHRFLGLYRFDLASGAWTHEQAVDEGEHFTLAAALAPAGPEPEVLPAEVRAPLYARWLAQARALAQSMEGAGARPDRGLAGELAELQYFSL